MAKEKIICKLCKIVYTTKEELEEHNWSLLHHKEFEAQNGKNSAHDCVLCHTTCVGLSAYVKHMNSSTHRQNRQRRLEGKEISPPKERNNSGSHKRVSPTDRDKPAFRSSRRGQYQGTPEGQDSWTGAGSDQGRGSRWDQDPYQTRTRNNEGCRRWEDQPRGHTGPPPVMSPGWNDPPGGQYPGVQQSVGGQQWLQHTPDQFHWNMQQMSHHSYYTDSFSPDDGFQDFQYGYRTRHRQDSHRFSRDLGRPRSHEKRYSPYQLRNRPKGRPHRKDMAHLQEDPFVPHRKSSHGMNEERRDRNPNIPEKELERPTKGTVLSGESQSHSASSTRHSTSPRCRSRSSPTARDKEKDHVQHHSSERSHSLPSSPGRRRSLDTPSEHKSPKAAVRQSDSSRAALKTDEKPLHDERTLCETERLRSEKSHNSRKSSIETPVMKAALLELSKVRKGSFKPAEKDTSKPVTDSERPKGDRDSYVQQVLTRAESLGNLLRTKRQEQTDGGEKLPVSLEQRVKRRMERFLTPRGEQEGEADKGQGAPASGVQKEQGSERKGSSRLDGSYLQMLSQECAVEDGRKARETLDSDNRPTKDTSCQPAFPAQGLRDERVESLTASSQPGPMSQAPCVTDTSVPASKENFLTTSSATATAAPDSPLAFDLAAFKAKYSNQKASIPHPQDLFKSPPNVSKSKDVSDSLSRETARAMLGRSTSCPEERQPRDPSSYDSKDNSERRISDTVASPSEGRVRRTSESDGSDTEGAAAKVLEKLQLPAHLQRELSKYLSAKNKTGSGSMQPNIAGARSRLKPGSSQRRGDTTETGLPSTLIQFLNSPKSRNKQHLQWSQLVQHQQGQKQKVTRLPRFGLQLGPPVLSSNDDLDPQAITINLQDIALHELSMEQLKEISEAAAELQFTADSDHDTQESGERPPQPDSVATGSSVRVKVESHSDEVPSLKEATEGVTNSCALRIQTKEGNSSSVSAQSVEEHTALSIVPSHFNQPNTDVATAEQESEPVSVPVQRGTEQADGQQGQSAQEPPVDTHPCSNDEGQQSEPVRLPASGKETTVTPSPQLPLPCSVIKQEKEDVAVLETSPQVEQEKKEEENTRNKRTYAEVDAAEGSSAAGAGVVEQVKKRRPQAGSETEASPGVNLNQLLTISLQEEGLHRKQAAVEQRIAEVKVIMQKAVDELHHLEVKKAQIVQNVSHLRQKRLEILQGAVSQRNSASSSRASTTVASPAHSTPRDQSPCPTSAMDQSKTTILNSTLAALDQSAISSANNSGIIQDQSRLTVQNDSSLNLSLGDTTVVRVKEEPVSPTSLSAQGVSQYATPPEFFMSASTAEVRRSASYASLPTRSTVKQRDNSVHSAHSSFNESVGNQPSNAGNTSAQTLLGSSGNLRTKEKASMFPTLDFSETEESEPLSLPSGQQQMEKKTLSCVQMETDLTEEQKKNQYQSPMLKQLAANFQQLRSASQHFLQEGETVVSTPQSQSTPVVSVHAGKQGSSNIALCSVDDLLLTQPGTSTKDSATGTAKHQKQMRGRRKKDLKQDNTMRPPSRTSSVDSVGGSKGTKKKKKKRKAFFKAAPSETSPDDHPQGPRRKPRSAKRTSTKSACKGGQAQSVEEPPGRDSFSEIVDSVLSQPRKVMKSPDSTEQVQGELEMPASPAESVSFIDVPQKEAEVLVIDSDDELKQDQVTSSHPAPTEEQNVVSSTCTGTATNSSPPEGATLAQLPRQQLQIQPAVAQKIRKQIKKDFSCGGNLKETPTSSQSDHPPMSAPVAQEPTPGSFVGHSAGVVAIQISGNFLYSVSADMVARAWDLRSRECVQVYKGHNRKINCLQVVQSQGDEERLYTGSSDKTVRCYNIQTAACVLKYELDDRVLCMHQKWKILYLGLGNGQVISINVVTRKCVDKFDCHTPRAISCITTGMEGPRRLLLVGSYDATISIRDARDGLLLKTLSGHSKTPLCMQVVNHVVYSGSADTMVMAHNINTGELQGIYKGHTHAVTGIHVLGNVVGKVMITASLDRLVRVFEVTSQEKLQVYGGQKDMIMCLVVHKSMVYVGCYDGSLTALPLDLTKNFRCWWRGCSLIFGIRDHLKQHLGSDHIKPNHNTITCCWKSCGKDFCMKKHDVQEVRSHLSAHVDQHYVMET